MRRPQFLLAVSLPAAVLLAAAFAAFLPSTPPLPESGLLSTTDHVALDTKIDEPVSRRSPAQVPPGKLERPAVATSPRSTGSKKYSQHSRPETLPYRISSHVPTRGTDTRTFRPVASAPRLEVANHAATSSSVHAAPSDAWVALEPEPPNSLYIFRPRTSDLQGAPYADLPLALTEVEPDPAIFNEDEIRAIDNAAEEFTEAVGNDATGTPRPDSNSPEYRQRWRNTQQMLDDRLRAQLGWERFNSLSAAARQELYNQLQ